MSPDNIEIWENLNRQYLVTEIELVHLEISNYLAGQGKQTGNKNFEKESRSLENELKSLAEEMESPAAIMKICNLFGLSEFERKILVLCAGLELDSNIAATLSKKGASGSPLPTFSLCMSVFRDAHWSAFLPESPLRHWYLIELLRSDLLTLSPIKINESVLHYLTGQPQLEEFFAGLLSPVRKTGSIVDSHMLITSKIAGALTTSNGKASIPLIQLNGEDRQDKIEIAHYVSGQFGLSMVLLSYASIPQDQNEVYRMARIWNRDSALGSLSLYIDCEDIIPEKSESLHTLERFLEIAGGVCYLGSRNWSPGIMRAVRNFEIPKPGQFEQYKLWKETLEPPLAKDKLILESLTSQFNLSSSSILSAGKDMALARIDNGIKSGKNEKGVLQRELIESCSKLARPKLDKLARRIEANAIWDDLILPDQQKATLKEISMHVNYRLRVYHEWGFAEKSGRGLGISALFTGDSGTGKTMAAEVIASELKLDLYRIDLSQVVNKYIGETEKNLKKIFDAADEGGVILLFDEADALFGKRSDVRDSHDRYANIEVSYLLQRMESYRGLAILTTNMKAALDPAFMRRIRFVVSFPFPGAEQRAGIWKNIYPANTPTSDLDFDKLSRLNVSGGNIRNIALNSAFIAASEGKSVQMKHILRAARSEYLKLNKIISPAEIDNWI
jgi:AAA+ superfamily predicted ATPase